MTALRIVDPHVHLWDLRTGFYPQFETPSEGFMGSNAAIARNYLAEEYLAEGAGEIEIVGAVHVEALPTDPVAEVDHLQTVADRIGIPFGIVGHADLRRADLGEFLDRQAENGRFRGIRQILNLHPDPALTYVETDFMADPAWHEGLNRLVERDLSFDLQIYPHQVVDAAAFTAAYPDLRVVLNHAGMWADRTPEGWAAWKRALRTLAACDNVWVKISGVGMFDHRWTEPGIAPLVFEVLEAFGPERAMFASNFPVDKLFGDFVTLWRAFERLTRRLSETERDALFRGTARRVYRL